MKHPTIEELKAEFARRGYKWFNFHVVAIRNPENKPNSFDDLIGWVDGDHVTWNTGTTEPGKFWLENPSKVSGTAVLKPGQYIDAWAIGYHKGQYKALCQAKPVTVYRDADKDGTAEYTRVEETGLFGINWHRANEHATSTFVEKWSAGCQVQNNPIGYKAFILACEQSGQEFFTGTLLD